MDKIKKKLTYAKITIEDILNIEESWDICDPMFNMIDGYEGYDKYLKTSERFTLEQRYLCAIHWYFGEVFNGGASSIFLQLYRNCLGRCVKWF